MPDVIALRFRYNPKQLWFDPAGLNPAEGDHVVVNTDRGTEIALACSDVFEATEERISQLPSPMKPIARIATDEDIARVDELDRRGQEAMPVFRELIEKYDLEMKPVRVEYLFSGDKAIFYFASEERVDFREIVRDLASRFHIRVDMRQIGVRDEARLVGGIAHCGQELCCARLGDEFHPVSIRMAKEQDLPLNPLKISGLCGRLMCCLRYEFEAYKDFKGRAPKRGALIETPMGLAKVTSFDTPREVIELRLEDGKQVSVPLASMDSDTADGAGGSGRPCRVSAEAMEACLKGKDYETMFADALDRELEDGVVEQQPTAEHRHPRRRSSGSGNGSSEGEAGQGAQQHSDTRKPRRRRQGSHAEGDADKHEGKTEQHRAGNSSRQGQDEGSQGGSQNGSRRNGRSHGNGSQHRQNGSQQSHASGNQNEHGRPRPGQNSSGIRGNAPASDQHAAGEQGAAPRRQPRRRHRGTKPPTAGGTAPTGDDK